MKQQLESLAGWPGINGMDEILSTLSSITVRVAYCHPLFMHFSSFKFCSNVFLLWRKVYNYNHNNYSNRNIINIIITITINTCIPLSKVEETHT